jgi:hypothetical protein
LNQRNINKSSDFAKVASENPFWHGREKSIWEIAGKVEGNSCAFVAQRNSNLLGVPQVGWNYFSSCNFNPSEFAASNQAGNWHTKSVRASPQ